VTRGPKLRAIGAGSFLVAAVLGAGAQPSGAAFAGHNGRIAFVSGSVILSATTSGKELRFLTSPGVVSTEPEFSPNGKLIVYARSDCDSPDGPCGLADLWRMAANGSHKQQLTDTAHTAEGAPAWSPSGKQIVFADRRAGTTERRAAGTEAGAWGCG
jgi:Tol biopolymer transport system component